MANVWPATQSQLYGELHKLDADGLIEVADIGPRGRKEYRVTAAGRAELTRWIVEPQDDPPYRSATLLRVFLLREVPPDQVREYMVSYAARADDDLARLERLRDSCSRGATATPSSTAAPPWHTASGWPRWRGTGRDPW